MTSRPLLGLFAPAALLVLAGCLNNVPGTDGGPNDTTCIDCNDDAGPTDAGVDAGFDAGNTEYDAGPIDAGPIDSGAIDAGSIDAGPDDAGVADAGVADAGEADAGTVDAGPDDAGPVDAGEPDAGSIDAGPFVLAVVDNPNNVLSAVATVSWASNLGLQTVQLTAVTDGGRNETTPSFNIGDRAGSATLPILALQPSTHYDVQATGIDDAGNTYVSPMMPLDTQALPTGMPASNVVTVTDGGTPTPGYTLVARLATTVAATDYVTIFDSNGVAAWYWAAPVGIAGDFQKQPDGTYTIAVTDTAHTIIGLNSSFGTFTQVDVLGNVIHTWEAESVTGAQPISVVATDGHELRIQPDGSALILGDTRQTFDLTAYGGKSAATVVAQVVERIEVDGGVAFAWNGFDHLSVANVDPVAASVTGNVVDFTHANSIDVMADGNYLVSFRNLSQVIKIDATTGDILWKLGGADGMFTFVGDSLGGFSCQHAARELPNGDIILFDDGDGHTPTQSRAVEYALDTTNMTATLVWSAEDEPPLYSYILGDAQRLDNGNTLIDYGVPLHVQEVDPLGNVIWDLFDPTHAYGLYRAFHVDSLYP